MILYEMTIRVNDSRKGRQGMELVLGKFSYQLLLQEN